MRRIAGWLVKLALKISPGSCIYSASLSPIRVRGTVAIPDGDGMFPSITHHVAFEEAR